MMYDDLDTGLPPAAAALLISRWSLAALYL